MVHTPLATTDTETSCTNLYVSTDRVAASFKVFDISRDPVSAHGAFSDNILCFLSNVLSEASVRPPWNAISIALRTALTSSDKRIGEIAAGFDRSRAGFSRQVTRELGLAPHAFRLLSRLNHARQLLREGQSIAAVATEAGFSDQSHMTRLFRGTFGTTPGLYRRT
ncbi:AraC family transcriptional regulator [Ochrobactrum sp. Marseille-Q0166]|nr:AraC family transcriptional regulator [Ochrobactrum sp. Marseille-Q0166]